MKRFKLNLGVVAVCALLLTSCSKEDAPATIEAETATLSFGALLNDMVNNKAALKQQMDMPECTDGTPAFVEVVLTGTENVGSMEDPIVVALNPTPGNFDEDMEAEWFTEESSELELMPGDYSLEFFAVYDGHPDEAGSSMLWLAPMAGGTLAEWVDDALPMDISLGAGVKKYVDVDVICFDDRVVNEYGYLFFDIENTEAIEFCIFGNFCPPSGRHFPAAYSVDVWMSDNGTRGELLHSDLTAEVALDENGDYAADPVCMALPDTEGMDEYYFEITMMSSDAYGDITEEIIRTGTINDDEVRAMFDGENNLDYYHFREGCEEDDSPPIFQDPDADAISYKACLTELNDSNAVAFAYMSLEGNTLETHVYQFNVEANMLHPQHIHGLADSSANATCPPESAAGADGWLSLEDGLPFYGPVQISLTNEAGEFPTADSEGMIEYHRTFTLGAEGTISKDALGPLENRAVVIHGMTVEGDYIATLPIGCAEIERVN